MGRMQPKGSGTRERMWPIPTPIPQTSSNERDMTRKYLAHAAVESNRVFVLSSIHSMALLRS